MSSSAAQANAVTRNEPVAPWWHTVLVMAPIAIGSVLSGYQHGFPNANVPGMNPRFSSYVTVLAIEWLPVLRRWKALLSVSRQRPCSSSRCFWECR
jgi:hypothetical protein